MKCFKPGREIHLFFVVCMNDAMIGNVRHNTGPEIILPSTACIEYLIHQCMIQLTAKYQHKLVRMRAELASLNHCVVSFLSRAGANWCFYYYTLWI